MSEYYSLSQNELSVILGGLLGDSSYCKKDNYIVFSHSIKQFEYLEWKHTLLENISNPVHKRIVGKSIVNGEDLVNVSFATKSSNKLKADYLDIKNIIFDDFGKKRITRKWLNLLTPLSLAIWWMDDGCLSIHKEKNGAISRYGKLCTHCFSLEEQYTMKRYFMNVWGIDVKVTPEKKYFFLRFTVPNLKKLFSIIYPYVLEVPSMIYKINMKYKIENIKDDEYKDIQIKINNMLNSDI